MAARTKAAIVNEAREIAKAFKIDVISGEHAGQGIGLDEAGKILSTTMTWEQAMIRLQLLQLEVLIDISKSESPA